LCEIGNPGFGVLRRMILCGVMDARGDRTLINGVWKIGGMGYWGNGEKHLIAD
jgi:hypothetical protein